MALLYADENFSYPVVKHLRLLGHDVLTAQEAGQAHSASRTASYWLSPLPVAARSSLSIEMTSSTCTA